MTYIYEWFSFSEIFSVICPKCNGESDCSDLVIEKKSGGYRTYINSGKISKNFQAKVHCKKCGYVKEKLINWERDAYWKFEIKGNVLWAWNIEHAQAILEFIALKDRKQLTSKYALSFLHIPEFFKLAKNREHVIKKIKRALNSKE